MVRGRRSASTVFESSPTSCLCLTASKLFLSDCLLGIQLSEFPLALFHILYSGQVRRRNRQACSWIWDADFTVLSLKQIEREYILVLHIPTWHELTHTLTHIKESKTKWRSTDVSRLSVPLSNHNKSNIWWHYVHARHNYGTRSSSCNPWRLRSWRRTLYWNFGFFLKSPLSVPNLPWQLGGVYGIAVRLVV